MLMPKKMKYRKQQRGKRRGIASRGNDFAFGKYAIKAMSAGWVSARSIESARRAMTRYVKKGGQIWIRIFPNKPVTLTSAEVPMGSGKGAVDHFVAVVRPGLILFEMDGIDYATAKEAMRLAEYKIPVKTKFISKEEE
ncbi:50S ribosomal protein L16 [Candidatus Berkelbacteria bacterium CG10_big_fil_rev_8_21_14_0_10_43_13]|uniref:Large ribosomal subunit protein uL16 n=1 Tax=Candidatus Berkelbacteria bacterium CG10_big_fil_rev_8_21_14_0_10_43_13 TaxID=1974514 RepID=A0A2H0W626_9BACT|nr:MAG: 50S ribosomal protein L16 [Candidatus Berkelbacteria bacterium CG10_big_fil_rev_8_21_14_0_10_43_13]